MVYKSHFLYILGAMLQVGGTLLALIGVFVPADRVRLIIIGLSLFLLSYLVNVLDKTLHQPRWKAGLAVLVWCGVCVLLPLYLLEGMVLSLIRAFPVSQGLTLPLKVLAFVAFVAFAPLLIGALNRPQSGDRLGACWLRGFRLVLLSGLVLLPWFLLYQGESLAVGLGLVETDSRMEAILRLLVMGLGILLVPLWAGLLSRRLVDFPLGRNLLAPFLEQNPDAETGMLDWRRLRAPRGSRKAARRKRQLI